MANKGQKQIMKTPEEKYEIIKPILKNLKSQTQVSKETKINVGLIFQWVKKYNEKGLEGLKNKTRPGNPLAKYQKRKKLTKEEQLEYENMKLIIDIHKRKPSYGYHRINKIIRDETGWYVSSNLVHKVCKTLNIKSKAKHYKYKKSGEESVKYLNIINGNWKTSSSCSIVNGISKCLKFSKLLSNL